MRKIAIIAGIFALFMLCSMVSAEFAGDGSEYVPDAVPAMAIKENCPQPPPCQDCCDILWDVSHGDSGSDGFSQYTGLVSYLESNGCTVTTTNAGISTPGALNGYEVLVINAGSSASSAYTAAEVSAVDTFVTGGGGLLVMDEWDGFHANNIEPVVSHYGTYNAGTINGWIHVTDLDTTHPIFTGVSTIYMPYAGPFRVALPSKTVATYNDQPVVTVVDGRKIVMIGDGNLFQSQNNFIGTDDNWQFAKNVFKFLCNKGTPSPEFPTVFLPAAFIIGFVGIVFLLKRRQ